MAYHKGKVVNLAVPKPVTGQQSKQITDSQIWLRQFNTDYQQVIKRISTAPNGLRSGGPVGPVS